MYQIERDQLCDVRMLQAWWMNTVWEAKIRKIKCTRTHIQEFRSTAGGGGGGAMHRGRGSLHEPLNRGQQGLTL
jgi:hypothetical protein